MITHTVTNQPPPRTGVDEFATNVPLAEGIRMYDAGWALPDLHATGRLVGSADFQHDAELANTHDPILRTHDRYGHRIDEVEYHPSYHRIIAAAVAAGAHTSAWAEPRAGANVARAAQFMLFAQVEPGHACPISMTHAAVPSLEAEPAVARAWKPALFSREYDAELRAEKSSALVGMGMTEKQGGSDVRSNTTEAIEAGDGTWRLTGHKWFCSAPMSDAFLTLAQTPGGLTCFLVPRVTDDGERNTFRIQRLKDKLGNRSNASSEVEFHGTLGVRLGEEGRGVATIIEMVAATRLDCVLGSTALMRRAVGEATWHAAHRSAFGRVLSDSALMQAVLADIALEAEAATALGMRLAASVDMADDPGEQLFRRVGLPLAKYWVCKRTPAVVGEALECLGGNGYVEDGGMPRLYREAPLNSIWEGAGNVQALDLLRVLTREPEALEAWRTEVGYVAGMNSRFDTATAKVERLLHDAAQNPDGAPYSARLLAGRMAVLLQASLLIRYAPEYVSGAFCATRLGGMEGAFGALPPGVDVKAIVNRATPALDD